MYFKGFADKMVIFSVFLKAVTWQVLLCSAKYTLTKFPYTLVYNCENMSMQIYRDFLQL